MKILNLIIFSFILFISYSWVNAEITNSILIESCEIIGNNKCILLVKTSSGNPAKGIKVSTDVSGGISCIGGRSFYTDSDGKVSLEWSSGCYLKKLYINGKGYDVDFKDGNSYTISL